MAHTGWQKILLRFAGLAGLFGLLCYAGSEVYVRATGLSTVKPFCGVALAICLIGERRRGFLVLTASLAGGLIAKQAFGFSFVDTVVAPMLATLTLATTYLLTRRLIGEVPDFRNWKQFVSFICVSAAASAISALLFARLHASFGSDLFVATFRVWFVPTTLSFVIFTPVIMLIATAERAAMAANRWRILGSLALLGAAVALTYAPMTVPLLFVVPLALLIVTMIAGIEGTALGLVLTQIGYTVAIVMGHGPTGLDQLAMGMQLQLVQAFLGILITVLLPVAAAVTERTTLRDRLAEGLEREEKANRALRDSEKRYRELAEREQSASRAKSEFLASMSHELRTPLNAVLGFTEVIRSELYGPLGHAKYREYADDVYNSGSHLLDLINDVLDLSKIDAGRMELRDSCFDMPGLVAESMLLIRDRARGHCELIVDVPKTLPAVTADKRLIKQILLNLLSNAVKFTPDGGTIRIAGETAANGDLLLHVSDTGLGMTEAELTVAFSHYGQIDSKIARSHHGTGLGLPISRALAELHGGTLTAVSTKGLGTRLTLRLPKARLAQLTEMARAS